MAASVCRIIRVAAAVRAYLPAITLALASVAGAHVIARTAAWLIVANVAIYEVLVFVRVLLAIVLTVSRNPCGGPRRRVFLVAEAPRLTIRAFVAHPPPPPVACSFA